MPSYRDIGANYKRIILSVNNGNIIETLINVFNSVVADAMSDFNSSFYYQNTSYHVSCYLKNEILD